MTMKLKKLITALFIGLFFSLHAQQEDANKILEKSLSQAKKKKIKMSYSFFMLHGVAGVREWKRI